MKKRYKALVSGGLGVIGRQLVNHLASLENWEVIGLSRRSPDTQNSPRYISVYLLDPSDIKSNSRDFSDVTHIFHAAYQEMPTARELIDVNLGMLRNLVEVVQEVSPNLERVVLYQGAKYYGAHLGSFPTPAREADPRHMPPDFYYDMQDWLHTATHSKRWSAVMLRPDVVCGYAPGNPMNLSMLIAVYASISRELGLPLRFPGTAAAYGKLAQVTDSAHLAEGSTWAATEAKSGESYNITNGDLFRWNQLWPLIANYFDMPLAEPQTLDLNTYMADKGPLWERMVEKYSLTPIPYEKVVSWSFGDFVFRCDWDVISSTTKIRQAGFHNVVDSQSMFLDLFDLFRQLKAIP